MGANAETVADTPENWPKHSSAAKASDKTSVIVMNVDAYDGWTTEGHTWWEVGTPHVTDNPKVPCSARLSGKKVAPNSARAYNGRPSRHQEEHFRRRGPRRDGFSPEPAGVGIEDARR